MAGSCLPTAWLLMPSKPAWPPQAVTALLLLLLLLLCCTEAQQNSCVCGLVSWLCRSGGIPLGVHNASLSILLEVLPGKGLHAAHAHATHGHLLLGPATLHAAYIWQTEC